jgi:general stress protein 26
MNDTKKQIFDFLKSHKYMTLATADNNGKPEAATVEYLVDGDNILLNSYVSYRKYSNLIKNPLVACVITEGDNLTLQFDAIVEKLEGFEAGEAKQKLLEWEPDFKDYFNDPDTRFFRIKPYWMRLRDYTEIPETEIIWEAKT